MARALNDATFLRRARGVALVLVFLGAHGVGGGTSAHAQAADSSSRRGQPPTDPSSRQGQPPTDPSSASSDSQVACSVAIECAAWTDLVELHAALRGEALHGASLALDGCNEGRARLVARWSDGARERRVDLADVPHRARARTVALLFADLAGLGPEEAREEANAPLATSSAPPSSPSARLAAPRPPAPTTSDDSGLNSAVAPAEESGSITSAESVADSESVTDSVTEHDSDSVTDSDSVSDSDSDSEADSEADPAVPSARDTALHAELDFGARVFVVRDAPLVPSGTLALRWRWLVVGAELMGVRRDELQGRVGAMAALGRLGVRTPTRVRGWTLSGELVAELGLARVQGRPTGDAIGAVERSTAIGASLGLRLARRFGPLRLGLAAELGLLRGLVGLTVDDFGGTREVAGVDGPSLRFAISVATP